MSGSNSGIPCDGWWHQELFGRQPMDDLRLKFDGGGISGSGRDIIGPFTFRGRIDEQGHVAMIKQYIGQHSVDYIGTYDGEGLLYGEWHIGNSKDRWLIRIKGSPAGAAQTDIAIVE